MRDNKKNTRRHPNCDKCGRSGNNSRCCEPCDYDLCYKCISNKTGVSNNKKKKSEKPVCPEGHDMVVDQDYLDDAEVLCCAECGNMDDDKVLTCEEGCNYDLCRKCAKGGKKDTKCPRGHLMQKSGYRPAGCDNCGTGGSNFNCCQQCDYDLCDNCS